MIAKNPRIALISTWDEVCGIAHHSYFLKRALDQHVEVTVFPTPRDVIQKARSKQEDRAADNYLSKIAAEIGSFDAVIVQFEPGIFGNVTSKSLARVTRLLRQSKNFTLAFHYIPREPRQTKAQIFRSLRPGQIMRNLLHRFLIARRERIWLHFYKELSSHARRHRVGAIAHTKRDARHLRFHLPGVEVFDNPLTYLDQMFVASIADLAETSRLSKLLPPPRPKTRYLGVFGFYSSYKGFDTVIRALKYLPSNYEVLMFASVHHASLAPGQGMDGYLESLTRLVTRERLISRVHFIGEVSNDDVLLGMMACDAVVIPYNNAGHAASGPASMAIELGRPTYCSRNEQFVELAKYYPNHFEFFDIGNCIELAQKIQKRAGAGRDRVVNGIRFVEFPAEPRPIDIRTTVLNYLHATGVPARSSTA